MGSGQTAIAAIKTDRYYVGYEIEENYVKLAEKRIREFERKNKIPELFENTNKREVQCVDTSSS